MAELIAYMIKVSIGISIVYLLYWAMFRKLTFFAWNRWYLLLVSLGMFAIPFVDVSLMIRNGNAEPKNALKAIPSLDRFIQPVNELDASFTYQQFPLLIIVLGMVFLMGKLLIQFISYYRLKKSSELISDYPVKVYQVHRHIIPFSFANSIFVNAHLHNAAEYKEIIRHEFIHVRQRHSVDILYSEIMCILNWYNPFARLIKKAIRQNLEFIADAQVIQNGFDKKQYQYLLLKVTGSHDFSIANKFNFTSLKKRIAMMNKNKSGKAQLLKFLIAVPLIAVALLAFRTENQGVINISQHEIMDTIPSPPDVQKLPSNVRSIRIYNGHATVILKDGTTEKYNLGADADRRDYEQKYGPIPTPPTPPAAPQPVQAPKPAKAPMPAGKNPPTPPAAPEAPEPVHAPAPPEPPTPPTPPEPEAELTQYSIIREMIL